MKIQFHKVLKMVALAVLFYPLLMSCVSQEQTTEAPVLKLKAAGYHLPRFAALFDGRVTIEGTETVFTAMGIGDMNTEVFSGSQSMDITEIGLHPFMIAYDNDNFRDYTLLPIYPMRVFRHKSIFIRNDRGIEVPQDLIGKKVGTAGYSSTSLTWIRGILKDEYGIDPEDLNWVFSDGDSSKKIAGKISAQEQVMPKGIVMITGSPGKDESDLLESGEVDVIFHAAEPRAFVQGDPNIERLFPDFRSVEQQYYEKTGVFPIMHAVAVRTSLLEEHPWLAQAIFDAYSEAKTLAYKEMTLLGWANDMLPWYSQELFDTKQFMGENFYSYGMDDNRNALETLFRYSYDQGFTKELLTVEDLFHPEALKLNE